MKKILTLTLALLVSLSIFGRPRENHAMIDARITNNILDELRSMGYTVLPEVIVQDTLNRHKQKFSSRYETKGGRGMMMPDWAVDSTWSPGQKQPKEFDDLYYQPSKDGKQMKRQRRSDVDVVVDTLVKHNPDIQVNYINNYDPFFYSYNIGRFYHGGFNYWMYSNPYYYNSYWMYDSYDWYWDMGFSGYPYWYNTSWYHNSFYFGYNNFYFGYNYWNPWRYSHYNNWNQNNWYGHNNNWNGSSQQRPEYGRRERPSNLSSSYNNNVNRRVAPQDKPMYQQQNRRSYTPSYETPRLSTRPAFNNSRSNDLGRNYERKGNMNGMGQGMMNGNRQGTMQRSTESRTQTRTYQPQPNKNYNTPSRSYAPAQNRSSEPQGFGRTFNFDSGSDRRSSGNSNFSSGSNNSSSGSGSSGGRSSGGSTTSSGRR